MIASARDSAADPISAFWTADQFLDFYMTRPDEERWQLVDGLAMMIAPPTIVHQRIAGNFLKLLDAVDDPRGDVYHRMLVRIPDIGDFLAAPDLLVTGSECIAEYFTEEVRLTADVICERDTAEMIDRKLELYRSHPDNLYCLTIDQDSIRIALWSREDGWARTDLRSLDDTLALPAFGFQAKLADIHKGTPLAR